MLARIERDACHDHVLEVPWRFSMHPSRPARARRVLVVLVTALALVGRRQRLRSHPRLGRPEQPPAADDDPQQPRRRLRPHRSRRCQGAGGQRAHRPLRDHQRPRRQRHRRDAAPPQRGGRRRPGDGDGARRRRRRLHQQVRGDAARDDADRPAGRGAGGHPRARPTRRSRRSTTWSRPGRTTPGRSRSAAAPAPAGPTTCSRCSSRPRSRSTRRTSTTSPTTAAVR